MLHSGSTLREGNHGDRKRLEDRRLGQILAEIAGLHPERLSAALARQQSLAARHRYYPLGRILVGLGYVSAGQVDAALAVQGALGTGPEPGSPSTARRAGDQATRVSEVWQAPGLSRPVHPISAIGALDGLAEKIAAGDLETMSPIPLGFDPLDEALGGGIKPGELILLGGTQGVGKTTMAFQMARNIAASEEATCLYVCYEHDEEHLVQRLIAMESVDSYAHEFRPGVTVRDLAQRIMGVQYNGHVTLYDLLEADPRTSIALQRLRGYGERLHLLKGSGTRTTLAAIAGLVESHRIRSDERLVLFVDYLQKVPVLPRLVTEQERVEAVVSGLKDLAMEQQIPVLAIVASDREGLQAKRMRAHHFLGGSLLAYEADVILMLADKYNAVARVHVEFNPQKAQALHDLIVCSVEKNRSGGDIVDMQFEQRFTYCCLNPNGSFVTEKLIDERIYAG